MQFPAGRTKTGGGPKVNVFYLAINQIRSRHIFLRIYALKEHHSPESCNNNFDTTEVRKHLESIYIQSIKHRNIEEWNISLASCAFCWACRLSPDRHKSRESPPTIREHTFHVEGSASTDRTVFIDFFIFFVVGSHYRTSELPHLLPCLSMFICTGQCSNVMCHTAHIHTQTHLQYIIDGFRKYVCAAASIYSRGFGTKPIIMFLFVMVLSNV